MMDSVPNAGGDDIRDLIEQSSFGGRASIVRATVSDEKARWLVEEATRREHPHDSTNDGA